MSKYIVLTAIFTAVLLLNLSCEANKDIDSQAVSPAVAVVVEQPASTTAKAIEPNKIEPKPEPIKIEQPIQPEPNTPAVPVLEPTVQTPKPAEPNVQQAVTANPALPDANSASAQLSDQINEFLAKYVNQNGMVDYIKLSRRKMDMVKLLEHFKTLDRNIYNSWSNDDKLAFWINSYNLQLTKIILDNYPIESNRMLRLFWPPNSIRHINGIWDEHKFIVMEEEFTLRAIDQRYFQNEFGDPRVFFAISYASVSGAPLRNVAYSGKNISAQLDEQVKRYLAGQNALKIDRENQKVFLSAIFNPTWYGGQFIAKYGTDLKFKQQEPHVRSILNFLSKYLSPEDTAYLETANYTVEYIRYDWTLNENGG